ncbi:hypothetical protein ACVBIL_17450 [Shewanella sp. 125m-7]
MNNVVLIFCSMHFSVPSVKAQRFVVRTLLTLCNQKPKLYTAEDTERYATRRKATARAKSTNIFIFCFTHFSVPSVKAQRSVVKMRLIQSSKAKAMHHRGHGALRDTETIYNKTGNSKKSINKRFYLLHFSVSLRESAALRGKNALNSVFKSQKLFTTEVTERYATRRKATSRPTKNSANLLLYALLRIPPCKRSASW